MPCGLCCFSSLRFSFLLILVLLLSGCQLQQSAPDVNNSSWQTHRQALSKIEQFQTRGSFAWLSDTQKTYARFNWQQTTADHYRLLLTSPFGQTELELKVAGNQVTLTDNEGRHYYGNNPEKLIKQLTGMKLPLQSLRQWILGLPADSDNYQLNQHYLLQSLHYRKDNQHWLVTYKNYDYSLNPPLPVYLELQQADQRIKLKMDSWKLP